jgi:flagellar hook-length control protein FliK
MASVPNMRLTPATDAKGRAAAADGPEADIFARLMATPGLCAEGDGTATLLPGDPTSTPAKAEGGDESEGEAAAPVDLALPAQAVDFLPLIVAQAAAPVTSRPATPAKAEEQAAVPTADTAALSAQTLATMPGTIAALPSAIVTLPSAIATIPSAITTIPSANSTMPSPATPEATRTPAALPSTSVILPAATTPAAPAPNAPPVAATKDAAVAQAPATLLTGILSPVRLPPPARSDTGKSKAIEATTAADAPDALSPVLQAALSAIARPAGRVREEAKVKALEATSASGTPATTPVQSPVPTFSFAPVTAPVAAASATTAPAAAAPAEHAIERELDLAHDAEWLDRLARDIAGAGERDGPMRFRLNPQTLGHLRVELSQSDLGTSIRLTADTEAARAILVDAQPRLMAEARAQGVRISESHVDLAGSGERGALDSRRQESERQNTTVRTARGTAEEAEASTEDRRADSARYA